jgi:hypothetical protein
MNAYNVEAIMAPIADEHSWDDLRDLIDVIPGTILIEDPDGPLFIFPVDADSWRAAFKLVDGLLKVRGVRPLLGRVCEDDHPSGDDCSSKAEWKDLLLV